MSQIQVPKLSSYVGFFPPNDAITLTRMSVYVWLEPGFDTGTPDPSQAHVYGQKITRG